MAGEEGNQDEKKGCCTKRLCIGITALVLLACGIAGVTVTCLILEQKVLKFNHHYGVIFDAGSSHTDVTVYRWPSQFKDHGTAHTDEITFTNCSDVGISSFADEPEKAGETIKRCVEDIVLKSLSRRDVKKTPIYLGATAGMRLLCKRDNTSCDAILDSIRHALNRFTFRQTKNRVQVLTGKEEATFGWITANIMRGALNESKPAKNNSLLIGALDMGGGSAEISFIPDDKNIPDEYSSNLTLYGINYSLYTHSYLCYGFNEAQRRLLAHLIEASNFSNTIINPCMNKGTNMTKPASFVWLAPCSKIPSFDIFPLDNKTTYAFIGNGSAEVCEDHVKELFNDTSCKYGNCTFDGVFQPSLKGHFIAFSGFGKTGQFLNMSKGDDLNKLKTSGKNFCEKDWAQAEKEYGPSRFLKTLCFQAIYSYGFLTHGVKFNPSSNDVFFTDKINGAEVGWSLGFMVNATNSIPVESPTYRISQQEFVSLLVVFSSLTIIGLAMFIICVVKRKLSKNMKYKYSMIN